MSWSFWQSLTIFTQIIWCLNWCITIIVYHNSIFVDIWLLFHSHSPEPGICITSLTVTFKIAHTVAWTVYLMYPKLNCIWFTLYHVQCVIINYQCYLQFLLPVTFSVLLLSFSAKIKSIFLLLKFKFKHTLNCTNFMKLHNHIKTEKC